MRNHTAAAIVTRPLITEIATRYDATQARVEAAYRRMREIEADRHAPADARTASDELAATLREATATASLALRLLDARAPAPHQRLHRHPKALRSVPPDVAAWSAELMRLTQIGVWLRRTTLDDHGVHVPTTVRVANYAATGPHIPGVDFGNQATVDRHDPQIGIDLPAAVDGSAATATPTTATPVTENAPTVPRAA